LSRAAGKWVSTKTDVWKVPWKGEDKLLYSHWDILVHVWKVPWKGEDKLLYSHWDILVHVWKVLSISNVFT
jgi:hypothetical protein